MLIFQCRDGTALSYSTLPAIAFHKVTKANYINN